MWQCSAHSNQTTQLPPHNYSLDTDSPSDPLMSQEEETLESQEEYPREVVEEAEEVEEEAEEEVFPMRHLQHKLLIIQETNSSATHRSYSLETAPNRRHS